MRWPCEEVRGVRAAWASREESSLGPTSELLVSIVETRPYTMVSGARLIPLAVIALVAALVSGARAQEGVRVLQVFPEQRADFVVPTRGLALGIEFLNHEVYGGLYAQARRVCVTPLGLNVYFALMRRPQHLPLSLTHACDSRHSDGVWRVVRGGAAGDGARWWGWRPRLPIGALGCGLPGLRRPSSSVAA